MIRRFILHWLDGKIETVKGEGDDQLKALADGIQRAGYGGGALRALDYWEEITAIPGVCYLLSGGPRGPLFLPWDESGSMCDVARAK